MKNEKIISILFLVSIFGILFLNIITPKKTFSENENRYLEKFPSISISKILSGEFSTDIENYVSDHFFNRDKLVGIKTMTQLIMLKKDNGRVIFGKDDYLFNYIDKIDENQLLKNTNSLKNFLKNIKYNTHIKTSVILVPTASEILTDKLPDYAPVLNQSKILDTIKNSVEKYTIFYNPYEVLINNTSKQLYYHTDHHWTSEGAYITYYKWAENMNIKPLKENKFNISIVSNSFYGTLYSKANLYNIKPDYITKYTPKTENLCSVYIQDEDIQQNSLYNDKFLDKKDKYSYFIGSNNAITEIITSIKNDKTLMLIKDSYAHCFVPFLAQHYEEIIMVDLRYIKTTLDNIIKKYNINEIMILYNVENFCEDKNISNMLKIK